MMPLPMHSGQQLPSQTDLLLPTLEAIRDAGGQAKPGAIYDAVAAKLRLPDLVRHASVDGRNGAAYRTFDRRVRWVRQTAVAKGLICSAERGVWSLTDKANAKLHNIIRGAIVTIFETDKGIMLWASAEDAIGLIERESVDLLLTSPPYALIKQREYGGPTASVWVDWMLRLCEGWRELLTPTGSMMINVGPTWTPGAPVQNLCVERLLVKLEDLLGIHLLQRLDWHSPCKLPAPLEYVGIRRIRVKPSVEPILWLSPNDPARVKADNRRVLNPYSKSGLRAIAESPVGHTVRPSGIRFGPSSFRDNGGSIPPSLIVASNAASSSRYRRAERAAGRCPHPATMPEDVARFGIRLATEDDDLVYDPFGGSGTTAAVAEELSRRWIVSERSRYYIAGAELRLRADGRNVTYCGAA